MHILNSSVTTKSIKQNAFVNTSRKDKIKCTVEIMQLIQKKSGKENKRQQKNRWENRKVIRW